MSFKKNLVLSIALLVASSAFSQDKIDLQHSIEYTFTNTVPATSTEITALPSDLSDFSSHYKNKKIVLSWKTEYENELLGFNLERSEDGKTFENVVFEKAKGNYSSGAYYEISDKKVSSEIGYIYRLSEINAKGNKNILKTVQNTAQNKVCKMSLDNYTVKKDLTVNIAYKNINEIILRVLDINGKVILIDHPKTEENTLNLEWLEKGTYTIKVATSEFELQKKIIKN